MSSQDRWDDAPDDRRAPFIPDNNDDELSIQLKQPRTGDRTRPWVRLIVGLMVFTLIISGVMLARLLFTDPIPAHLAGTWHGTFNLVTGPIDATYILDRDGRFRQIASDMWGQPLNARGKCEYGGGQITIRFDRGQIERAAITMTDANTMKYRIVEHDDVLQRGVEVIFKRE